MQTNPLSAIRPQIPLTNHTILSRQNATALSPGARPTRPESGDTVVLSRQALAQSQQSGAQSSPPAGKVKASIASGPVAPAAVPPSIAAETPAAPRVFGQTDLDLIRDHFGLTAQDKGFSAEADADGNGVIDFRDLTHVLANWGQARS